MKGAATLTGAAEESAGGQGRGDGREMTGKEGERVRGWKASTIPSPGAGDSDSWMDGKW